jgi:hypothetical protein
MRFIAMQLWWKARRDPSRLRPQIKTVYDERVGHTFQRRYWVRAPEAQTANERHKIAEEALHAAGVLEQYKDYDEGYAFVKRNWFDIPGRQMTMGHWEYITLGAHKRLREAFGGDRVAVFIPLEQAPEELQVAAEAKDEKANAPLFALMRGMDAELAERIVKDWGLPPFYYFAIASSVMGEPNLAKRVIKWLKGMQGYIWGETVPEGGIWHLWSKPVPSQVPNPDLYGRSPIYVDEYLGRHLSVVEREYFEVLQDVRDEFESHLKGRVEKERAKRLHRILKEAFWVRDKDEIKQLQKTMRGFVDWITEHPGAFKTWLSFLVPAEEHDVATLGFYAYAKTALDCITLMSSTKVKGTATNLLSFLQKRFEHWADEGKKALGLEMTEVPTETLIRVVDRTLRRFGAMDFGWSEVNVPEVSVRMLTLPIVWTHLKNPQVRRDFKDVAEALVGEPLKKGFEKFPQRRQFYEALRTLIHFSSALSSIGAKALDERKMLGGIQYDDKTLWGITKRAVGKFRDDLSQVVKMVTKAKEVLGKKADKKPKGAKDYAVAVVGFSPADFHTLTRDLFWSDSEQAYRIGTMENSYVLRVFVPGKGMMGGAWGFLDPDKKAMVVRGYRSTIRHSTLKEISSHVASALFGVPPENLKIHPVRLGSNSFEISVGSAEQK